MNTKLLKINAMKRFTRWLDINNVATYFWDIYNPLGKIYAGIERRAKEAHERDIFCEERGKKRQKWSGVYSRLHHYCKAEILLGYIKKRYERKKNGHK